jgi:hypothetical protein
MQALRPLLTAQVQEYTDIARCRLDDIEVVAAAAAATAAHGSTAASVTKQQQQQLFTSAHCASSGSTNVLSAEASEAAAEAEGILRYVQYTLVTRRFDVINMCSRYTYASRASIVVQRLATTQH